MTYDPNGVGVYTGQFFGFPYTLAESELVYLSIPWDLTTSYGSGTSKGPQAMLEASPQLDFFDINLEKAWARKRFTFPIPSDIQQLNDSLEQTARDIIDTLESGKDADADKIAAVNEACQQMIDWVYKQASFLIKSGKKVILVGGDHSTPLGFIKALDAHYDGDFGILQIDAHADLRPAYEGFTYSHASIMYNVLEESLIQKLVQVGIRDICPQEKELAETHDRVSTFYDEAIQEQLLMGSSWFDIQEEIVSQLPQNVYISFDIDGLDPVLCPNTGTPVPGGLSFAQATSLIKAVVDSGRTIIGADMVEVCPSGNKNEEWDANVGSRLLYKMSNLLLASTDEE